MVMSQGVINWNLKLELQTKEIIELQYTFHVSNTTTTKCSFFTHP